MSPKMSERLGLAGKRASRPHSCHVLHGPKQIPKLPNTYPFSLVSDDVSIMTAMVLLLAEVVHPQASCEVAVLDLAGGGVLARVGDSCPHPRGPIGPPRKIGDLCSNLLMCFGPWRNGMNWGREVFFPANPDIADILGDMGFDVDHLYFLFFGIPKFQVRVPRFPEIWPQSVDWIKMNG